MASAEGRSEAVSQKPGMHPVARSATVASPARSSLEQFRCTAVALNTVIRPISGAPFIIGTVRCCRQHGHEGEHYGKPRRSRFNRGRWVAKTWDTSTV
jgi:hypothetical protein